MTKGAVLTMTLSVARDYIDKGTRCNCVCPARVHPPFVDGFLAANYAAHAAESGMEPPKEPIIFFKATTAWAGPNDNIIIPRNSEKTDWEVELAVVIGKQAKYVPEADALSF